MTDTSPAIAAATLDHSERIRLLTEAVEKQRRTISKMGSVLTVLVVLGLQGWISDLFHGGTVLKGRVLELHAKGTGTAVLSPTENGLAVLLEGDNVPSTGGFLEADKEGKVLWKSR